MPGISGSSLTFVPGTPSSPFHGTNVLKSTVRPATSLKRRRVSYRASMHFLDPVHSLPEFINHVMVSCGIGLAGIAGAKATEEARALTAGDQKADRMDALARDIDSRRRRKELANVGRDRDWNDVGVDRYANVVVEPEVVPELESRDDLEAFDKLLMDSPAAKRFISKKGRFEKRKKLPGPTEFKFEDED